MDFNQKPSPTRDIVAVNLDGMGEDAAAAEHPWGEPFLDFRGQVSDDVAARQVNPYAGGIINRRAGDDEEFVAGPDGAEMARALAKNGTVHSDAEAGWALRGQRRRCTLKHTRQI